MCVIEPQVTEEGTRRAGGARPLLRACSLGPAWALLPHAGSHSPPLPGAVLSRRSRSIGWSLLIMAGAGQPFPTWLTRCPARLLCTKCPRVRGSVFRLSYSIVFSHSEL